MSSWERLLPHYPDLCLKCLHYVGDPDWVADDHNLRIDCRGFVSDGMFRAWHHWKLMDRFALAHPGWFAV